MEGRSHEGLRKGTWTAEEDNLLRKCIEKYGEGKWHQVPSRAGLNRCRKSCRLRWLNYLKPSIKRGRLSPDEVDLVIRLHKLLGNRWSLIAGRLPGRTANDVKNYWNTHLSKKQDQSSCKKKIGNSPTKPLQKIDVIKPRPRSFSHNSHARLLNASPGIAFPGSGSGSGSNNNNSSTSSNNRDNDDKNNGNNCELCGNKTSNKDEYEVVKNIVVDEGREKMWWESLLEDSEEAKAEEEKITAVAAAEEAESSWMATSATFDVDFWNLLNSEHMET